MVRQNRSRDLTHEQVIEFKKAAAAAFKKIIETATSRKRPVAEVVAKLPQTRKGLLENKVALSFGKTAVARGFLDLQVLEAVYDGHTVPVERDGKTVDQLVLTRGAVMAVEAAIAIREKTEKAVKWFNRKQIEALLKSLTSAEVASLNGGGGGAESLEELADEQDEDGPVEYLRRYVAPRDNKPAPGDRGEGEDDEDWEEEGDETNPPKDKKDEDWEEEETETSAPKNKGNPEVATLLSHFRGLIKVDADSPAGLVVEKLEAGSWTASKAKEMAPKLGLALPGTKAPVKAKTTTKK